MYVCHCNPFTDHDLRDCLGKTEGRASVAKVYRACSGGNNPNCGTCLATVKEMVRAHNAAVAVREIGAQLPCAAPAAAPAPAEKKVPEKTAVPAGRR
jgi:bacterioferritin-associated ferredoxin